MRLRTVSTTPLAADAADDVPRAWMMAAPRCWTFLMKSPWSHSVSEMESVTGAPLILALV